MLIDYVNACRGMEPTSSGPEGLPGWGRVGRRVGRHRPLMRCGATPGSQPEPAPFVCH